MDLAIFVSIMLIGFTLDDLASLFLWIGDTNELSVLLLEETIQNLLASPPNSDAAEDNAVTGSNFPILAEDTGRD